MSGPVERYFVVAHTHWDREWYRPFEHFRLALGPVGDEVLDTLERDPEFRSFTLDGQAIVLEDYVAVRPENESRLRTVIAAGRIEIGPSYVLPDEFLVGGESPLTKLRFASLRNTQKIGHSRPGGMCVGSRRRSARV
jgi:alpha-mannosidase